MHADIFRDWLDKSNTPYRVRSWDGKRWTFLRTHTGSIRRFSSLAQACAEANRQPLFIASQPQAV
jgi:hypothetical protein